MFQKLLLLCCCLILSACSMTQQKSNAYPAKPINLLVPWAPGGLTDLSARSYAAALQKVSGQSVNVINRTGGGGVVGHLALNQAKADGYTLGAVTIEIAMLHHLGRTALTYEDYSPIVLLSSSAATITVRKESPWNSVADLLADVEANPGLNQASGTARGGIWDLARAGFLKAAGLPENSIPWVPSQGSSPALQELISGGVDMVTAGISEVKNLYDAGEVKILAVMAPERLAAFPEIPTLSEQGINWSQNAWISICAPPGLPNNIQSNLDSLSSLALQDSSFIESLKHTGASIHSMHGEALSRFLNQQDLLHGDLLKLAGMIK